MPSRGRVLDFYFLSFMPSLGRVLIFLGSFIVVEVPRLMLFIFFFREIIDLSIGGHSHPRPLSP